MASNQMDFIISAKMDISSIQSSLKNMSNLMQNSFSSNFFEKNFANTFSKLEKDANNFTTKLNQGLNSSSDAKGLQSSFAKLTTDYESFVGRMKSTFASVGAEQLFPEEITNQILNAKRAMDEFQSSASDSALNKTFKDSQSEINNTQKEIDKLNNKIINLSSQKAVGLEALGLKESEIESGLSTIIADMTKLAAEKDKLNKGIKSNGFSLVPNAKEIDAALNKYQALMEKKTGENSKFNSTSQANLNLAQQSIMNSKFYSSDMMDQNGVLNVTAIREKLYQELTKAKSDAETRVTEINNQLNNLGARKDNIVDVSNITKKLKVSENDLQTFQGKLATLKQDLAAAFENTRTEKLDELRTKLGEILGEDFSTSSLEQMQTKLDSLQSDQLDKVREAMLQLQNQSNGTGSSIDQLNNKLKEASNNQREFDAQNQDISMLKSRISYYFSLYNIFRMVGQTIKKTYNNIKELDAVMKDTAVVSDYSISDMWDKLPQYAKRATDLGVAIKDVYEADTLYYQQGLKTNQVIQVSGETLKMMKIAGLDAATATDRMTNALRGFNMQITEANATRVNDVYSALAAKSASNVDEISTAMTKVASIADNAGMSFENTAAFLAQIIETTRESAETAGTALKTVIARFSEVKKIQSEGKITGEDEEGELINVNKVSTALQSVGISMSEFFKGNEGLDSILLQLAEKWDSLDTVTQRYIATQAAGSRQQSRFLALMQDYSRTVELTSIAENSAGASAEQFEKTQSSLESMTNRLSNAWNQLLMAIADSTVIKGAIKILETVVNVINAITGATGDLKGLLLSFGGIFGAIGIGSFLKSNTFRGITDAMFSSKTANGFVGKVTAGAKVAKSEIVAGGASAQVSMETGGTTAGVAIQTGATTASETIIAGATAAAGAAVAGAEAVNAIRMKGEVAAAGAYAATYQAAKMTGNLPAAAAMGMQAGNLIMAQLQNGAAGWLLSGEEALGASHLLLEGGGMAVEAGVEEKVTAGIKTKSAIISEASAKIGSGASYKEFSAAIQQELAANNLESASVEEIDNAWDNYIAARKMNEAADMQKISAESNFRNNVHEYRMDLKGETPGVGYKLAGGIIKGAFISGLVGLFVGKAIGGILKKTANKIAVASDQQSGLSDAQQGFQDLSKAALDNAESINETREEFKKLNQTLRASKKGTSEYAQALLKTNEKFFQMANDFSELLDPKKEGIYYTKEDGAYQITEAGLMAYENNQLQKSYQAQALSYSSKYGYEYNDRYIAGQNYAESVGVGTKSISSRERNKLASSSATSATIGGTLAGIGAGALYGASIGTAGGLPGILIGAAIGLIAGIAGGLGAGGAAYGINSSNAQSGIEDEKLKDLALFASEKGFVAAASNEGDLDTFATQAAAQTGLEKNEIINLINKSKPAFDEYVASIVKSTAEMDAFAISAAQASLQLQQSAGKIGTSDLEENLYTTSFVGEFQSNYSKLEQQLFSQIGETVGNSREEFKFRDTEAARKIYEEFAEIMGYEYRGDYDTENPFYNDGTSVQVTESYINAIVAQDRALKQVETSAIKLSSSLRKMDSQFSNLLVTIKGFQLGLNSYKDVFAASSELYQNNKSNYDNGEFNYAKVNGLNSFINGKTEEELMNIIYGDESYLDSLNLSDTDEEYVNILKWFGTDLKNFADENELWHRTAYSYEKDDYFGGATWFDPNEGYYGSTRHHTDDYYNVGFFPETTIDKDKREFYTVPKEFARTVLASSSNPVDQDFDHNLIISQLTLPKDVIKQYVNDFFGAEKNSWVKTAEDFGFKSFGYLERVFKLIKLSTTGENELDYTDFPTQEEAIDSFLQEAYTPLLNTYENLSTSQVLNYVLKFLTGNNINTDEIAKNSLYDEIFDGEEITLSNNSTFNSQVYLDFLNTMDELASRGEEYKENVSKALATFDNSLNINDIYGLTQQIQYFEDVDKNIANALKELREGLIQSGQAISSLNLSQLNESLKTTGQMIDKVKDAAESGSNLTLSQEDYETLKDSTEGLYREDFVLTADGSYTYIGGDLQKIINLLTEQSNILSFMAGIGGSKGILGNYTDIFGYMGEEGEGVSNQDFLSFLGLGIFNGSEATDIIGGLYSAYNEEIKVGNGEKSTWDTTDEQKAFFSSLLAAFKEMGFDPKALSAYGEIKWENGNYIISEELMSYMSPFFTKMATDYADYSTYDADQYRQDTIDLWAYTQSNMVLANLEAGDENAQTVGVYGDTIAFTQEEIDQMQKARISLEGLDAVYERFKKELGDDAAARKATLIYGQVQKKIENLSTAYDDLTSIIDEYGKDSIEATKSAGKLSKILNNIGFENVNYKWVLDNYKDIGAALGGDETAAKRLGASMVLLDEQFTGNAQDASDLMNYLFALEKPVTITVDSYADVSSIEQGLWDLFSSMVTTQEQADALAAALYAINGTVVNMEVDEEGHLAILKVISPGGKGLGGFFGGGGKSAGGGGGGGGGGSVYDPDYDKLYNILQKITQLQEKRNQLEQEYEKILRNTNLGSDDLLENMEAQRKTLLDERELQKQVRDYRLGQIENTVASSGLSQYAWWDAENQTIQINWDKINAVKSEDLGKKIDDYIKDLEEWQKSYNDAVKTINDIDNSLNELLEKGEDEYIDFEDRILEWLKQNLQDEIDELTKIDESINNANERLMESIQQNLEQYRQERDNQETKNELADKEARIAYLSQDTSGANALEILNLQKELEEAGEDYTDTLIDQKISALQEQNDQAAQQRQDQIDALQSLLDTAADNGLLWQQIHDLMADGIVNGHIEEGSDLWKLIMSADGDYKAMSEVAKKDWWEDLQSQAKAAMAWYKYQDEHKDNEDGEDNLQNGSNSDSNASGNNYNNTGGGGNNGNGGNAGGGTNWQQIANAAGLTMDEVKLLQKYLGVTADGQWGSNSQAAAQQQLGSSDLKTAWNAWRKLSQGFGGAREHGAYVSQSGTAYNGFNFNALDKTETWNGVTYYSKGGYLYNPADSGWTRHSSSSGAYWVSNGSAKRYKLVQYKTGGAVDFTGPAWLDGTKSKPEMILNAKDTQNFIQLKDILSDLMTNGALSSTQGASENSGDFYLNFDIQVEQLSSDYDVEQLTAKIKSEIYDAASYRNNNIINLMR